MASREQIGVRERLASVVLLISLGAVALASCGNPKQATVTSQRSTITRAQITTAETNMKQSVMHNTGSVGFIAESIVCPDTNGDGGTFRVDNPVVTLMPDGRYLIGDIVVDASALGGFDVTLLDPSQPGGPEHPGLPACVGEYNPRDNANILHPGYPYIAWQLTPTAEGYISSYISDSHSYVATYGPVAIGAYAVQPQENIPGSTHS